MAISLQTLYLRVNTDLSTKGKEGYHDNDTFNRDVRDTQNTYMNYLLAMFEEEQRISDSLNPFLVEKDLPIVTESYGAYVNLPSDYRRRVEMGYFLQINDASCPGGSTTKVIEADQLNGNETLRNENNSLRGSSKQKNRYKYTFVGNRIRVFPNDLTGQWYLKYVKDFPDATRAITFDAPNNQENYDAANTVDLIWDAQDEPNFIDLLLFYKAGIIKDTALMRWVMSKNQFITPKQQAHV